MSEEQCINEDCRHWSETATTLCSMCVDSGWTVDKNRNCVEPPPRKKEYKYYNGWPLYRCQHCGVVGGH